MNSSSPIEELRELVDRLFDDRIDDAGIARIDQLIVNDPACLQTYVERLDFHGELVEQADRRSPEATTVGVLNRFSDACEAREARLHWRTNMFMIVCSLLMAVGLGSVYYSAVLVPAPIGTVASLSTDLQTEIPLELGQFVRWGQTIQVSQGIASLQLPGVIVDLVGPVSLKLERKNRVFLTDGTVVAKVEPDGIGFMIRTPDTEVVDLGTEFLVHRDPHQGTHVSVRKGEAHATLLDWRGTPTKVIELTASRAVELNHSTEVLKEVAYSVERFTPVDRSRKGIRRLTGALRTVAGIPASLASDQLITPNHLLVIPEQQILLTSPLTVESISGSVTIPAGATVSSYLIHYDPTDAVSFAPRGAVNFFGKIAAIIGHSSGLVKTDSLFGQPETMFESQDFRELELDEDEILISDDKKTASFYFGVSPPEFLDEARILVIDAEH